jgi:hypothetical protein
MEYPFPPDRKRNRVAYSVEKVDIYECVNILFLKPQYVLEFFIAIIVVIFSILDNGSQLVPGRR